MSKYECKLPKDPTPLPDPSGRQTMLNVPELQFPRKLENCKVRIYYGSKYQGVYLTGLFEIWLLAPNIVKITDGKKIWIEYNVTIQVEYWSDQTNR